MSHKSNIESNMQQIKSKAQGSGDSNLEYIATKLNDSLKEMVKWIQSVANDID